MPEKVFYLGVNYQDFFDLRQNHKNIQTLGDRFQKKLEEVGDDFLLLTIEYVQVHGRIAWTNPVASRNSSGSPLFRNILYALCAADLIDNSEGKNIAFVCEDRSLIEWITNLKGPDKVQSFVRFGDRKGKFYYLFSYVKRILSFFIDFIGFWLSSRLYLKPVNWSAETVLLRSWVNKDVLSGTVYEDRNFGDLGPFLSQNGKNVLYAPLFFNLGKGPFGVVRDLAKFNEKIIIPERGVGFFSWISVVNASFFRFKKGNYRIGNHDLSSLVKSVHYDSFFCKSDLQNMVFAKLLHAIKKSGGFLEKFIYTFESNTVEKNSILTIRSLFKGCEIIGFQHSVWYKNQMGMKVISEELSNHPLPDKIVTSGKKYKSILGACGFPKEKIFEGPNLRFANLNALKSTKKLKSNSSQVEFVLIVLNFDLNQNIEMLEKVSSALRNYNREVRIKNHPLVNESRLRSFLKKIEFPNYSFIEGQVNELVQQSLAVIMPACSVSNLEVLCHEKPLIRVSIDNNFNFDPIWENEADFVFCKHAVDVLQQLLLVGNDVDGGLKKRARISSKVLNSYFSDVTPDSMKAFLI